MQVVIHAGAHRTDEDRILKCLAKNRDMLSTKGVDVPTPARYRRLLRDTLHAADDHGISPEAREVILDAIVENDESDRVVMSNEGFFGTPRMAVSAGKLYTAAEKRIEVMQQVFHNDQIELFLGLRNPATFLPAMYHDSKGTSFADFMSGADPMSVRWSELITRLRAAFPALHITVWCNEDTPLIWAEVVRELAGLAPNEPFKGEYMLLSEIMTKPGMARFRSYLESHPVMTEVQKRRVIAAFLDKFAKEDEIEEELDLPGWTEELVDALTDQYDEDVYAIQRIPGIDMITP